MTRVFHISEEPNIKGYKPRPIQNNSYGIKDSVVMTIMALDLKN